QCAARSAGGSRLRGGGGPPTRVPALLLTKRGKKKKGPAKGGRPTPHATTGHTLIFSCRSLSPPLPYLSFTADGLPSHVRAVRAGARATSKTHHAPMQTEQRQLGPVRQRQASPKASRSPLSSPRIHEHQHIGRGGDQPEPNSSARLTGSRRRIRRVGKRTQKAPSAKRNAQQCETLQKVPRWGRPGRNNKLLENSKLLESPIFLCGLVMFHLV